MPFRHADEKDGERKPPLRLSEKERERRFVVGSQVQGHASRHPFGCLAWIRERARASAHSKWNKKYIARQISHTVKEFAGRRARAIIHFGPVTKWHMTEDGPWTATTTIGTNSWNCFRSSSSPSPSSSTKLTLVVWWCAKQIYLDYGLFSFFPSVVLFRVLFISFLFISSNGWRIK